MAHPKRRQSKTRTLKRRTHDKALLHWQYALTVALTTYTTQYVLLVATIVARWLS